MSSHCALVYLFCIYLCLNNVTHKFIFVFYELLLNYVNLCFSVLHDSFVSFSHVIFQITKLEKQVENLSEELANQEGTFCSIIY